jgi:hypothetical protein
METLQTVVDVLKSERADAADLSGLEARMSRLQAEAEEQAVQLQAARLTINTEATRNHELRQQISLLGKQRDSASVAYSVCLSRIRMLPSRLQGQKGTGSRIRIRNKVF